MRFRRPRFENRALLDLAHRLQTCPACGAFAPEGLEPAHSNQARHGHGTGIKSHDVFHAALCHACHRGLDQGGRFTREEKQNLWQQAHEETLLLYFENGWLKIIPR